MRFADPHSCPDCRGVIAGQPACPDCGLDLTSTEASQLWQTLLHADELLDRARRRRVAPNPPAASASPRVPPPPAATSAPAPRPGPRWSVGTVLLILGPFALVVAGLIFVTTSWDDFGLAARTLILLGFTIAIGGLGAWVTRRPLRASAEAVWSVFLALLGLDFAAAHHEGLAGLGSIDVAGAWIAGGVVGLALCVGIGLWARPHVKTALVVSGVAAGLALTGAGSGAAAAIDDRGVAWRAVLALVVVGLLGLAARPAGLPPVTTAARVAVAGFFAVAYVAACIALVGHPALGDLVGHGQGVPLVLMAVASVAAGRLVPPLLIPATALAVLAPCLLVIAPVADAGGQEPVWATVAALAAFLAVMGFRGTGDWARGLRLGAIPSIVGIVLVHLRLLVDVVETAGRVFDDPWHAAWHRRLDAQAVGDHSAWVVPVVLLGLVAVAWFVARWPEFSAGRPHAPALRASALALGAVNAVVAMRWSIWAAALSLLLLAIALVALRVRRIVSTPSLVPALLVVIASVLAAASHGVSTATWFVGGLVLVLMALLGRDDVLRDAHAVVGVGLVLAGTAATVELLDVDRAVTALVVALVALAILAAAELVVSPGPGTVGLELGAGVGLAVALVCPGAPGEIALRWTVAGAGLIALSFVATNRRWLAWPGVAALVVAYAALIVDSGFSFVEAYTLPLGLAGLATGTLMTTRKPDAGTWTLLGPGLAVALLPSVPQALADPAGLRALLLGAATVVVLAVGVRLRWQAPFLAGATIAMLLVLFNIGPYANAAPRVVVLALVGVALTGVGITWEDRVRDGRKLVAYVRSMR